MVCGRSPADIVGSNPTGSMDVFLLWVLFVLSGRSLCDQLIARPEEFYRLWCVVVCDLETSWMRRLWPTGGCRAKNKHDIKYWNKKKPHLFQLETFVRACPAATRLRRACLGHAKLPSDIRKLHETNSALCNKQTNKVANKNFERCPSHPWEHHVLASRPFLLGFPSVSKNFSWQRVWICIVCMCWYIKCLSLNVQLSALHTAHTLWSKFNPVMLYRNDEA
jgi:hypothetical protein